MSDFPGLVSEKSWAVPQKDCWGLVDSPNFSISGARLRDRERWPSRLETIRKNQPDINFEIDQGLSRLSALPHLGDLIPGWSRQTLAPLQAVQ